VAVEPKANGGKVLHIFVPGPLLHHLAQNRLGSGKRILGKQSMGGISYLHQAWGVSNLPGGAPDLQIRHRLARGKRGEHNTQNCLPALHTVITLCLSPLSQASFSFSACLDNGLQCR